MNSTQCPRCKKHTLKEETKSAGAIADCDNNEVETADFNCFANAATEDSEVNTDTPFILLICKGIELKNTLFYGLMIGALVALIGAVGLLNTPFAQG